MATRTNTAGGGGPARRGQQGRLLLGWLGLMLACGARAQVVDSVITNALFEPHSVAVDTNNSYYVTDSANNRIVKYVPDTAALTSLAGVRGSAGATDGTGIQARFFDPKGIIYVPSQDGLIVADSGNHTLRLVSLRGVVTTLAGAAGSPGFADGPAATARFRFPSGLAVDATGNVFIADAKNNAIRKLDTNLVVSTLAAGFYEPGGVAVGDTGEIYVADTRNHSIKRIATDGAVTLLAGSDSRYVSGSDDSVFATEALFNGPSGLHFLGSRSGVLIADTGNHTLRRLFFNTNADVQGFSVETFAGTPGQAGFVNGAPNVARFNNPIGIDRDRVSGGFVVVDLANSALRRIQTSAPLPPVRDPVLGWVDFVKDEFGDVVSRIVPVTQAVFNNDVIIAVLSEAGTETFFTVGPTPANAFEDTIPSPTRGTGVTPPPYENGLHPEEVGPSMLSAQADMTIKVISMQDGRRPSSVVQGRFQFKTANPIVIGDNPASFTISNVTVGASMFYTIDGSEPTADGSGEATVGPVLSGDRISLVVRSNLTFRARAVRQNFKPSEIIKVEFSPTNFIPNRISFGFEGGEASSDFVAAAGQTFFAPVTLSLLPAQRMYSLQFNLQSTNATGPPVDGSRLGFVSMLKRIIPGTSPPEFRPIPPAKFTGYSYLVITNFDGSIGIQTNSNFASLIITNQPQNLLGVGWLERFGQSELYNTRVQDLITYSIAHDTLFLSENQRVIVGGYSVGIPSGAQPGDSYEIQVDRPSATEDGIAADVFLDAPQDGDLGPGRINAVKRITVGQRQYVVGDAAPFRWFNAGDFGDTNLLNNDIVQVFQSAIYALSMPPAQSDLFDAMDSSSGLNAYSTTNLLVLSSTNFVTSLVFNTNAIYTTNVTVDVQTTPTQLTLLTTNFLLSTNLFATNFTVITTNTFVPGGAEVTTNTIVSTNAFVTTNTVVYTNDTVVLTNQFVLTNTFLVTNTFVITNAAEVTFLTTNAFSTVNTLVTTNYYISPITILTNISVFTTNQTVLTNLVIETSEFVITNVTTTTNATILASPMLAADGNDLSINTITHGDGILACDDIFVTFRRALDPTLVWYARFWSNGVRQAVPVPNRFRGEAAQPAESWTQTAQRQAALPAEAQSIDPAVTPFVTFRGGEFEVAPGEQVSVAVPVEVTGSLPIRVLMLNLNIVPVGDAPPLVEAARLVPSSALGEPTLASSHNPGNLAAAWLDNTVPGLRGSTAIGRVAFRAPAVPNTSKLVYRLDYEHASASPNGIALFPQHILEAGALPEVPLPDESAIGDGIPDSWRLLYFSSVTDAAAAADADPDGDGTSNRAEFLAGTKPTDPLSNLKLALAPGPQRTGFTVRWQSVSGIAYLLESAPALNAGSWTPISTRLIGTGAVQEFTDGSAASDTRFYRIRIVE
jgi:streptogramin lyase